jgi:hypothetical protein
VTDRGFIPGTYPEPSSEAGAYARTSWKRRVARDYGNGEVPLRVLRHRYGKTDAELAAIAGEFEIPARHDRKGRA